MRLEPAARPADHARTWRGVGVGLEEKADTTVLPTALARADLGEVVTFGRRRGWRRRRGVRVDLMQVVPWRVHRPAALGAGHVVRLVVADLLRDVHELIALVYGAVVPASEGIYRVQVRKSRARLMPSARWSSSSWARAPCFYHFCHFSYFSRPAQSRKFRARDPYSEGSQGSLAFVCRQVQSIATGQKGLLPGGTTRHTEQAADYCEANCHYQQYGGRCPIGRGWLLCRSTGFIDKTSTSRSSSTLDNP